VLQPAFSGHAIASSGNPNWSQFNNAQVNKAMEAAEKLIGTQKRAEAWAKIDREIVAQAGAVPVDWDKQAQIESNNVAGVGDVWNVGSWDYNFTSLK
jgi:ABC-type transport system substrate-binding protein